MLHRTGEIELPPVKRMVRNRIAERARPARVVMEERPLHGSLGDLQPLEFVQVRRSPEEALFNSLLEQHHYLSYERPVGEHLKYLIKASGQVIACLAWSSAPRHLKLRDRYLGWSEEARRAQYTLAGLQHALSDSAVGRGAALGVAHSGAHGEDRSGRLATSLRASDLLVGDVRRHLAVSRARAIAPPTGRRSARRRDAAIARRRWSKHVP